MIDSRSDMIRPFDDIIGFYFSMTFNAMSCSSVSLFRLLHAVFHMIAEGMV